jgi:hypothetical protein
MPKPVELDLVTDHDIDQLILALLQSYPEGLETDDLKAKLDVLTEWLHSTLAGSSLWRLIQSQKVRLDVQDGEPVFYSTEPR